MKISKLNIDGNNVDVSDKNAIKKPNSPSNGQSLVYDSLSEQYVPIDVDTMINLTDDINNEKKPVTSKAVNKKIGIYDKFFMSGLQYMIETIQVDYIYNPNTRTLTAKAYTLEDDANYGDTNNVFEIRDALDILVYDNQNLLGILSVDTNTLIPQSEDYPECYEGTMVLPASTSNRILRFVIMNPITDQGQVRISRINSILANDNPTNHVLVSYTNSGSYETALSIRLNHADSNSDIKFKITVKEHNSNKVTIYNKKINSGSTSTGLNLPESGYTRDVYIEMENTEQNAETYDIDYPIIEWEIEGRIPAYDIFVATKNGKVFAQCYDVVYSGEYDFRQIRYLGKYTKYSECPIYTQPVSKPTAYDLQVSCFGDTPETITINILGFGHSAQYWAEQLGINESEFPLKGDNIYGGISFNDTIRTFTANLLNNKKYCISNHIQYRIFLVDNDGYLQDAPGNVINASINPTI